MMSAGQVWLAAALVLFAGVPHFVCQCPGGRVKLFCSGAANKSDCCCPSPSAGGCCQPHAPKHQTSSCCATHGAPRRPESPPDGGRGGGGCTRTLEPADDYLPTTGPDTFGPHVTATAILPPPAMAADGPSLGSGAPSWLLSHALSPPPDLVTLLQHLLI
jgi:hypothetical protein